MRNRTMVGALVAASALLAASPALVTPTERPLDGEWPDTRHRRSNGKLKLPRHGQKLKSCRVKIGRRVRRKHRRVAA